MRKAVAMVVPAVVCLAFVLLIGLTSPATARPPYFQGFGQAYPNLGQQALMVKCNVCHAGNPKQRNNYGSTIAQNLRMMPFFPALKAAESAPSAIKGKTFGDLIKAGKLPASTQ